MTQPVTLPDAAGAPADSTGAALERGDIVYFARCPLPLPDDADLEFLRTELPAQTSIKNVSYHPESDSVPRFKADAATRDRAHRILSSHSRAVADYLRSLLPHLAAGWTVGTTSFRGTEERGRDLKPRASNEIVHIDAGAYGATNGDRILRFFVNVNPDTDRIWGTRGNFAELLARHPALLDAARGKDPRVRTAKGLADRGYSALVRGLMRVNPLARVIDSSPYDRAMRRIHNYMKENEAFRAQRDDYQEIRFPPGSAWMVCTDGRSHSVVSGQHALVTTILVPLANCRHPETAPLGILQSAA